MNITEFEEKIAADNAFNEKFLAAAKNNEVDAFLKQQGCDFTAEQLFAKNAHPAKKAGKEMADEELACITGGAEWCDAGKCRHWHDGEPCDGCKELCYFYDAVLGRCKVDGGFRGPTATGVL